MQHTLGKGKRRPDQLKDRCSVLQYGTLKTWIRALTGGQKGKQGSILKEV